MRKTVLVASAIMALRPRLLDSVSIFALVEAVAQRYQFKSVPTPDQLSHGPANFHYGKIEREGRTIVIDQLLVTYIDVRATSISASTKTSTDDAAFFLTDLLQFAHTEFALDVTKTYPDYFHSILEVAYDKVISFPDFQQFGELITSLVRGYGFNSMPEYQLTAINLHVDPTIPMLPQGLPFTFERRAGAAFSENKYFSRGPLTTEDHEHVLLEIERVFSTPKSVTALH